MNQQKSTDLFIFCGPKTHQSVFRELMLQDIVEEIYDMLKLTYRVSMRAELLNRKGWEACRKTVAWYL